MRVVALRRTCLVLWLFSFVAEGSSDGREATENTQQPVAGEVTETPRDRARVLLKRNPLASEFQEAGTLGRSPGAAADGEGSDFRSLLPPTGQLLESGSTVELEVFATLFEGPLQAKPAFNVKLRRGSADAGSRWMVEVRASQAAAQRLTEYNSVIWEPFEDWTGEATAYIMQRPRIHQDAIQTRTRSSLLHLEYLISRNLVLFAQYSWTEYFDESLINQLEFNLGSGRPGADGAGLESEAGTITEAGFDEVESRRYFRLAETRRYTHRFQAGGRYDGEWLTMDYAIFHSGWEDRLEAEGWNFYEGGLEVGYRVPVNEPFFPEFHLPPDYDLRGGGAQFGDYRDVVVHTRDIDWAGRVDMSRRMEFRNATYWISGGLHYRSKKRNRDWWNEIYSAKTDHPMALAVVQTHNVLGTVVRKRYPLLTPQIDPVRIRMEAGGGAPSLEPNRARARIEQAQELYDARENVVGGYGQLIWHQGRWSVEVGLRGELTDTETTGTVLVPEESDTGEGILRGEVVEAGRRYTIREVPGFNRYHSWLPTLDIEWNLSPRWTLRATKHHRLMRPQYFDIVNYRRVSGTIFTIREGNPGLSPVGIDTWALAADYRNPWLGAFSMELYSVSGNGFFYGAQRFEVLNQQLYSVSRVENGGRGTLRGFEAHWDRTFGSDKRTWTTALAYTFSDSEAKFPTRPGERLPLPERSRHHLKGRLDWTFGSFGGNASFAFQTVSLDQVGPGADRDIYRDKVSSLNAGVWWRWNERWRARISVLNLMDAPERSFEGNPLRLVRNQYAFRAWRIGVEATF